MIRPCRILKTTLRLIQVSYLFLIGISTANADEIPGTQEHHTLIQRLNAAEQRIYQLEQERQQPLGVSQVGTGRDIDRAGTVDQVDYTFHAEKIECPQPKFFADYDGGFLISPVDKQATPFELKINGRMQFRYVGFDRDRATFSNRGDTARGGPLPVFNRNDFDIERARLMFSGYVYDSNLEFFLNLDGDTDDNHRVIAHDFWFNYKFSDAFNLHAGKAFVPGSRDWLSGSTRTHLADRSMATTFFRPDRSLGVWAIGEMTENLFYRAMLSNGFNTTDLRFSNVDTNLAYSGSMWWDATGDYGKGYADLAWHEEPAIRVGQSFTFANQSGTVSPGVPRSEQNFLRLSDGTRIITPGALAPGVTVTGGHLYLYAIDAAAKYRGFSFNAEYFFRWLSEFKTRGGPIPHSQLYDDGFYTDVGYMLIEKSVEIVGRISTVDGLFGDSWEYAGGINWYVNGTHKNKLTLDIAALDGSPASNSGPNYAVGQDGILTRLQWQIAF